MTYCSEFDAQVVHKFAIVVIDVIAHFLREEELTRRHFGREENANAIVVEGVDQCYESSALTLLGQSHLRDVSDDHCVEQLGHH